MACPTATARLTSNTRFTTLHPFVRVSRHRRNIMCEQDTSFSRPPFKHYDILRSRKANILNADDIQLRLTPLQATDNVAIEILVGSQTEHALQPSIRNDGPTDERARRGGQSEIHFPSGCRLLAVGAGANTLPHLSADVDSNRSRRKHRPDGATDIGGQSPQRLSLPRRRPQLYQVLREFPRRTPTISLGFQRDGFICDREGHCICLPSRII